MTFGERVRYVRETVGRGKKLSLDAFGQQIGISGPAVSKIESGQNNASDQTIMMISKIYNVKEIWLRTGEGEMFADEEDQMSNLIGSILSEKQDGPKRRFMKMLAQLNVDDWDDLDRIMDKMIDGYEKPGD